MKFVRYTDSKGVKHNGLWNDGYVTRIEGSFFDDYCVTTDTFLGSEVTLVSPFDPRTVYCVGLNYRNHIKELGLEEPKKPANFIKPNSSITEPSGAILYPASASRVDYEGELALVVKNTIKNVSEAEALNHILGVMPLNDVTEREISYDGTQVTYSKSFDTFLSFGPIIDTSIDPDNTTVRTYLNGKKVQEGNTSDLLFSCAYIVSYFAKDRTLFPGDIISTGTPFNVQPMQIGDRVEVEIEGIGLRLVNTVRKAN